MPKRMLQGTVVSDKLDKTVVVLVERRFTHPVLKKTVRRSKKYHAHDETNEYAIGDTHNQLPAADRDLVGVVFQGGFEFGSEGSGGGERRQRPAVE